MVNNKRSNNIETLDFKVYCGTLFLWEESAHIRYGKIKNLYIERKSSKLIFAVVNNKRSNNIETLDLKFTVGRFLCGKNQLTLRKDTVLARIYNRLKKNTALPAKVLYSHKTFVGSAVFFFSILYILGIRYIEIVY